MNKGLAALNELKFRGFYYSKNGIDISSFVQMRLDFIEAELKEKQERIKKLDKMHTNALNKIANDRTKLKAFEIIKRAPSEVIEIITTYDSWEEYVKDYPISDKTIWHIINNRNEFDLLKGALL